MFFKLIHPFSTLSRSSQQATSRRHSIFLFFIVFFYWQTYYDPEMAQFGRSKYFDNPPCDKYDIKQKTHFIALPDTVLLIFLDFIYFSRYNLIYIILVIHGIGTLLPWNMFITANDVSKRWSWTFLFFLYVNYRNQSRMLKISSVKLILLYNSYTQKVKG